MAGIVSTDITRRFLLPPEIVQAHDEGIIHFHDADYFGQNAIHNCLLINLEDMLQNGTCINIERDEEVVRNGCKIVDFTKSSAGVRSIYLNKEARKILGMRCVMSCIFKKRAVIKLERHLYLRYLIMDLILIKYVKLLVMRMKGQVLIITVLIEGAMTLRKTF